MAAHHRRLLIFSGVLLTAAALGSLTVLWRSDVEKALIATVLFFGAWGIASVVMAMIDRRHVPVERAFELGLQAGAETVMQERRRAERRQRERRRGLHDSARPWRSD